MDAWELLEIWLAQQPNVVGCSRVFEDDKEIVEVHESGLAQPERQNIETQVKQRLGSEPRVRWVCSDPPHAY